MQIYLLSRFPLPSSAVMLAVGGRKRGKYRESSDSGGSITH
jgi:hypothetical protein